MTDVPAPVRTPRHAIEALRIAVSQALQCVTDAHLGVRLRAVDETTLVFAELNRLLPARLQAPTPLALTLRMIWLPVRQEVGWVTRVSAYWYALFDDHHEIIMYHWHPAETPRVIFPHLHLEAGSGVQRDDLTRAHLPTGNVTLAAFVRLAITDFGVSPRRDDWPAILAQSEQAMSALWRPTSGPGAS